MCLLLFKVELIYYFIYCRVVKSAAVHHILYDRHREPVFNSVMTHFPAVYILVYLSYLKTKDFNLYQKKIKITKCGGTRFLNSKRLRWRGRWL